MKTIRYIFFLLLGSLMASCMGADYADANLDADNPPYGNNALEETEVLTIQELKEKYQSVISNSDYTQILEKIQIKGIVTGNDEQGNIYQEISLQDSTGALLVCVAASGIYGYLPVGQEILVDLDSLYIGGYGQQCEVGGVYTNTSTGAQSIGRTDRYTWQKHFKLIGTADTNKANDLLEEFDKSKMTNSSYLSENCGKLMTISGVTLKEADGSAVYAPDDGSVSLTANSVNRNFKEYSSSNLVLRTSTYADFAKAVMPTGKLNITGIFTRYRNTWQILIRSTDDVSAVQ